MYLCKLTNIFNPRMVVRSRICTFADMYVRGYVRLRICTFADMYVQATATLHHYNWNNYLLYQFFSSHSFRFYYLRVATQKVVYYYTVTNALLITCSVLYPSAQKFDVLGFAGN